MYVDVYASLCSKNAVAYVEAIKISQLLRLALLFLLSLNRFRSVMKKKNYNLLSKENKSNLF